MDASSNPETLAKRERPGFVPFGPGRTVGWIVDPVTSCWHWTGEPNNSGTSVVYMGRTTMSAALALWLRAGHVKPAKGHRLYRTCASKDCVNPVHRIDIENDEPISSIAFRLTAHGKDAITGPAPAPDTATQVAAELVDALDACDRGVALSDRYLANVVQKHRAHILRALHAFTLTTDVLS